MCRSKENQVETLSVACQGCLLSRFSLLLATNVWGVGCSEVGEERIYSIIRSRKGLIPKDLNPCFPQVIQNTVQVPASPNVVCSSVQINRVGFSMPMQTCHTIICMRSSMPHQTTSTPWLTINTGRKRSAQQSNQPRFVDCQHYEYYRCVELILVVVGSIDVGSRSTSFRAGFVQYRVQFSPSAHTCRDFFLHKNWLAESARAWVSNIRWKSTSSGNAEPYAR